MVIPVYKKDGRPLCLHYEVAERLIARATQKEAMEQLIIQCQCQSSSVPTDSHEDAMGMTIE